MATLWLGMQQMVKNGQPTSTATSICCSLISLEDYKLFLLWYRYDAKYLLQLKYILINFCQSYSEHTCMRKANLRNGSSYQSTTKCNREALFRYVSLTWAVSSNPLSYFVIHEVHESRINFKLQRKDKTYNYANEKIHSWNVVYTNVMPRNGACIQHTCTSGSREGPGNITMKANESNYWYSTY